MNTLPDKTLELILSFVHPLAVMPSRRVCSSWRGILKVPEVVLRDDYTRREWIPLIFRDTDLLSRIWATDDAETLVQGVYDLYMFFDKLFGVEFPKCVNIRALAYSALIVALFNDKHELAQDYVYSLDRWTMGTIALVINAKNIIDFEFDGNIKYVDHDMEFLAFCDEAVLIKHVERFTNEPSYIDSLENDEVAIKYKEDILIPFTVVPKIVINAGNGSLSVLHVEIFSMILAMLNPVDLLFASLVSHDWERVIQLTDLAVATRNEAIIDALEFGRANLLSQLCSISRDKSKLVIRETHKIYRCLNIIMWYGNDCCTLTSNKICYECPWFIRSAIAVSIKFNVPAICKELMGIDRADDKYVNMAVVCGNVEAFKYFHNAKHVNKFEWLRVGFMFACPDKNAKAAMLKIWREQLQK